jgi:formate hydrogenlyase subunit 3/multisubunit Na+/H+ antiporter MnhD subunit
MTIALPLLIPLIGALLALLGMRRVPVLALTSAVANLLACGALAVRVSTEGAQRQMLGGWEVPLGIALHADGLSVAMLLLTAVAGLLVTAYAAAYYAAAKHGAVGVFWPLWLLLWGGLNGLYLSSDVFNIYVLLEVLGVAGVALVVQSQDRTAAVAGMRYLLAALTGSLAYLLGVALLYGAHATLDMYELARLMRADHVSVLAFALMSAGLMMKTALFPLHFWLPQAHAAAPVPVSAILSGLVVKASFYLMLRLWLETFENVRTPAAVQLAGALGAAAILWGSYQALRQRRLKLLIAHSTVGQIGYFFLLFPLTMAAGGESIEPWMTEAWNGGIYQALSHGLAKAAMFLAAGVMLYAMGTDELRAMRDIAGRLPLATFALGLAGATLIGLPPSGGFIAKWMLLHAVFASGQWWWVPVIVAGSLLTAGYVFLMLRYTFVPRGEAPPLEPVPALMQYSALVLALLSVLLGLRLEELLALLAIASPFAPAPGGGS